MGFQCIPVMIAILVLHAGGNKARKLLYWQYNERPRVCLDGVRGGWKKTLRARDYLDGHEAVYGQQPIWWKKYFASSKATA